MKRKIVFGLLGLSAAFFLYCLIMNILKVTKMFKEPELFTLVPILFAVICLVIILCHGGIYVLLMDRKAMNVQVTDDDRWWEKWDRV